MLGASCAPTIEPVANTTAAFAPVKACAAARRRTFARATVSSIAAQAPDHARFTDLSALGREVAEQLFVDDFFPEAMHEKLTTLDPEITISFTEIAGIDNSCAVMLSLFSRVELVQDLCRGVNRAATTLVDKKHKPEWRVYGNVLILAYHNRFTNNKQCPNEMCHEYHQVSTEGVKHLLGKHPQLRPAPELSDFLTEPCGGMGIKGIHGDACDRGKANGKGKQPRAPSISVRQAKLQVLAEPRAHRRESPPREVPPRVRDVLVLQPDFICGEDVPMPGHVLCPGPPEVQVQAQPQVPPQPLVQTQIQAQMQTKTYNPKAANPATPEPGGQGKLERLEIVGIADATATAATTTPTPSTQPTPISTPPPPPPPLPPPEDPPTSNPAPALAPAHALLRPRLGQHRHRQEQEGWSLRIASIYHLKTRTESAVLDRVLCSCPELEPLRHFMRDRKVRCRWVGAAVFLHPDHWMDVIESLQATCLEPGHIVVAGCYLRAVQGVLEARGLHYEIEERGTFPWQHQHVSEDPPGS